MKTADGFLCVGVLHLAFEIVFTGLKLIGSLGWLTCFSSMCSARPFFLGVGGGGVSSRFWDLPAASTSQTERSSQPNFHLDKAVALTECPTYLPPLYLKKNCLACSCSCLALANCFEFSISRKWKLQGAACQLHASPLNCKGANTTATWDLKQSQVIILVQCLITSHLILIALRVLKLGVVDACDPSTMGVATGKPEVLKARPDHF